MVIDGYQILGEIYRGPVTTVYQARHLGLDRSVLLKVLNLQWRETEDLKNRFSREAKIGARLDHTNIVRIFDYKADGNDFFIAMEFIEGINLHEFVQQHHPLPFPVIHYITVNILKGLTYAHMENAIHRDIKPSNIMISRVGEVKITDFGLAVISDLPQITEQGQTVGSPSYMSPEQALNKSLDKRTDLFSLGTTIYELCTKIPPFQSDNIGTTIHNILTKQPNQLFTLRPDIPSWFSDITHQLLQKKPFKRPADSEIVLKQSMKIEKMIAPWEIDKFLQQKEKTEFKSIHPVTQSHNIKKLLFRASPIILIVTFILFWILQDSSSASKTDIPINKNDPGLLAAKVDLASDEDIKEVLPEQEAENIQSNIIDTFQSKPRSLPAEQTPDPEESKMTVLPGKLFIVVNPWAKIYINDDYIETTPLTKPLSLKPGKYKIELRNPNYKEHIEYFESTHGQVDTLYAQLKLNRGLLVSFVYLRGPRYL